MFEYDNSSITTSLNVLNLYVIIYDVMRRYCFVEQHLKENLQYIFLLEAF